MFRKNRKDLEDELASKAEEMSDRIKRKQALIQELDKTIVDGKKVKYDPNAILMIQKINNEVIHDKIIFLEKGLDSKQAAEKSLEKGVDIKPSGYNHIIEKHGGQFKIHEISIAKLPYILFKAIETGDRKGGRGKVCHKFMSEKGLIATTIGSNGYIVQANPDHSNRIKNK